MAKRANSAPATPATGRGQGAGPGGGTSLLADPHHLRADLNTVSRAVRERWPVLRENRPAIVERLQSIVAKTECSMPSAMGPMKCDGPADANAIKAAGILRAMEADNQADEFKARDEEQAEKGMAIGAMLLASGLSDRQKIDLYMMAGKADLLPARLRELAEREGLLSR